MRALLWTHADPWHAEMAMVNDDRMGLWATGVQMRAAPRPFTLEYTLHAGLGYETELLELTVRSADDSRQLVLRQDPATGWMAERDGATTRLPELADAVDVDILDSPLTNTMPVRRHGIVEGGSVDLTVAFVRVPGLSVEVSHQRYEHLARTFGGARVRYTSLDSGFTADLDLDSDGFVIDYPGLASRRPTA